MATSYYKLDIESRESVGKKPPPEISVILKLRELNNLTPDKLSKLRIPILRNE